MLALGSMLVGCSKDAGSLTAPTASFELPKVAAGTGAAAHVRVVAPAGATANCDTPTFNSVVFDQTQFGHVTVNNTSRCTNDFLFAIWDAGNYDDQTLVSWTAITIAPGGTAEMTLGIPNPTCTRYQRDVYFGITKPTVDNMHNFFVQWSAPNDINVFYANGDPNQQPGGICEPNSTPTPPVVVPPVVPPIVPPVVPPVEPPVEEPPVVVDDPPPTVVVPPGPPTVGFCHVEYNVHTQGRDHVLVTTFVHEQNLSITQQAITNGHSDPAHHFYDHLGACTGQYAPIITQGPQ
jgi:hypothetical protein